MTDGTLTKHLIAMREQRETRHGSIIFRQLAAWLVAASLAACSWLPAQGPSSSDVVDGAAQSQARGERYALVSVDASIVSIMQRWTQVTFSGSFGAQRPISAQSIGVGDSVQIMIWEAAAGIFRQLSS